MQKLVIWGKGGGRGGDGRSIRNFFVELKNLFGWGFLRLGDPGWPSIDCYYKTLAWNFEYCRVPNRTFLLLVHCRAMHIQSCFTVPRHVFLIGLPIIISKPWILNWILVESLETINNLCTLYLSLKTDTSPSPVAMVKS